MARMKVVPRQVVVRGLVIATVVVALVLVGFGLAQKTTSLVFVIASGVLSSLVASLVLGLFATSALAGSSDMSQKLEQVDAAIARLEALESAIERRRAQGVAMVSEKYEHKPEYWNALTAATAHRFLLVGRALDTWVEGEYRQGFLAAAERVARNGGDVCVILMAPTGPSHGQMARAQGRDYSDGARQTVAALAEVHRRLPAGQRKRLDVRFMPEGEQPWYMVVVTDTNLEYSPYFQRASTRKSLHLSLRTSSPFWNAVLKDVDGLRQRCTPVDLTTY